MGDANDAIEHDAAGAEPLGPPTTAENDLMGLLAEHVPLALLADLVVPSGPPSTEILQSEGLPDVPWWEMPDGDRRKPSGDETQGSGDDGENAITA